MRIRHAPFGVLLIAAFAAAGAQGQTHFAKCRDARGQISYSDRGCAAGETGREMRTSGFGSEAVPPPKKRTAARSGSGGSQAVPKAPQPSATSTAAPARASQTPASNTTVAADEQAEGDRLRAIRQDYQRDVNRTRNKAAEVGIPGFR